MSSRTTPDAESAAPVTPRPAATIVVARRAASGLEILLLQRPAASTFGAGAYVFPGGAIDEDDASGAWEGRLPPAGEPTACAAALRELFEETGILPEGATTAHPEKLEEARRALLANRTNFSVLAERLRFDFSAAPVVYFARWITPRNLATRFATRFDTRFFLLAAGKRPRPVSLTPEHDTALWATPAAALRSFAAGELPMLFPTVKTLERLAGFTSPEAALEGLRDVRVRPALVKDSLSRGDDGPHVIRHAAEVEAVRADNAGALTLTGTQTYVIGSKRLVVLDPGPRDASHLTRVDDVVGRRPVAAVCLTHAHRDHAASASEAMARWGELRASAATLSRLGLEGRPLADDETIALGGGLTLRALATPGHSADHLCYLLEPARILFTGDLVLGKGSSMILHPDGSVSAYLASLARLASLRPSRLLPGHGPVVADAPAHLEACRTHRLARADQVRRALASGARTPEQIREMVYGDLSASRHGAAEITIRAYLAYLEGSGQAAAPGR